jgi:hypothetical protein
MSYLKLFLINHASLFGLGLVILINDPLKLFMAVIY